MTQNVYKKLIQAVFANDCRTVAKHWKSKDLANNDQRWAFLQAVHYNHPEIAEHMLKNTTDIATLLESDFGSNLHFLAEKNSASDTLKFQTLTHLLVSYSHHLSKEQQYETFAMFAQFEHDAATQMAEVVGYNTVHSWLDNNPQWKESFPELMQKIVLRHTVEEEPSAKSSNRKM